MPYFTIGFDDNGVIAFESEGKVIYNPFEVALQAMIGKSVLEAYKNPDGNLIPRYYPLNYLPNPTNDSYSINAINWILKNENRVGDCSFWEYQYDIEYNGEKIKSPWRSAFGQSYVILATLLWYKYTHLDLYKKIALRAINGLILPIDSSGIAFKVDGGIWFEEIPSSHPTHIFNAHLISILALMESGKILNIQEYVEPWIQQGISAFNKKRAYLDSGNWSTYDIPHNIDFMLQLVPKDPGKTIKVRSIGIVDGLGSERTINVGDDECFTGGLEWVSGIDWGKIDELGYREIKYGPYFHPVPVPTGDRQNSFVYFKNVSTVDDTIALSFQYKSDYDTELLLYKPNYEGKMISLGFTPSVPILQGEHFYKFYIPCSALSASLSDVYHKYHILLLEELCRLSKEFQNNSLIEKFRSYIEKNKRLGNNKLIPLELSSIYVSVNKECGLSCKMCDMGTKNNKASLYKNLHPENSISELDGDLLIERCRQALKTLKQVHIIGTEPTLYKNLPQIIKKLKDLNLTVIVTTNGINLERMLPNLLSAGLDQLWISIDGPEKVHNSIRGRDNLHESIVNTLIKYKNEIKAKKELGFLLNVSCAITPMNYEFLAELILSTKEVPIDCYWYTHMNYITEEIALKHSSKLSNYEIGASCIHPDMDHNLINTYVLWKSICRLEDIAEKMNKKIVIVPKMTNFLELEDYYKRPNINVSKTCCDVASASIEINCDGSVCIMSRCYKFDIGNIYEKTLNELFYSLPLIKFRNDIYENGVWEPCKRCCGIM